MVWLVPNPVVPVLERAMVVPENLFVYGVLAAVLWLTKHTILETAWVIALWLDLWGRLWWPVSVPLMATTYRLKVTDWKYVIALESV